MSQPDSKREAFEEYKKEGNNYFQKKLYEQAQLSYTKAIQAKSDEAVAYSNRAMCYIYLKCYFEAKEDCDRAIELDKTFVKAYYRRALALKNLNRFDGALQDFEQVFRLDPSFELAKEEIKSIKSLLEKDERCDIKSVKKPQQLMSKKELKSFELNNQYTGTRLYSEL